jgi:hypothetical protein
MYLSFDTPILRFFSESQVLVCIKKLAVRFIPAASLTVLYKAKLQAAVSVQGPLIIVYELIFFCYVFCGLRPIFVSVTKCVPGGSGCGGVRVEFWSHTSRLFIPLTETPFKRLAIGKMPASMFHLTKYLSMAQNVQQLQTAASHI